MNRNLGKSDLWVRRGLTFLALGVLGLLVALLTFLIGESWASLTHFKGHFLTTSIWDPVHHRYGALPVLYGTLMSSFLAVLIAAPISIGAALYLTELAPQRYVSFIAFFIEMLAAIPSVVFGLWGLFILAPFLKHTLEPFLSNHLGFLPFFEGAPLGIGMLCASLVLAMMIAPTLFSISYEVFRSVPRKQKEAALALGATPFEAIKLTIIEPSVRGIAGAILLGLGRALGETMAVTMVIGNRSEIALSLFAPSQTMASVLANEYAEAMDPLHISALVEVGLVLLMLTFCMNALARIFIFKEGGR